MPSRRLFRLYIVGRLGAQSRHSLTVLAECRAGRAVETTELRQQELIELDHQIEGLRTFIEDGTTPFEQEALRTLGGALFDLIIRKKVRDLFMLAKGTEQGILPCEIVVEDYALAGWPWEFLFDESSDRFICQDFHPVSRGIFGLAPSRAFKARSKQLRILVVIGSRRAVEGVDPDEEVKSITNVFDENLQPGSVDIDVIRVEDSQAITRRLQAKQYDVLHYIGHAGLDAQSRQGYLSLDRHDGTSFRFLAVDVATVLLDRHIRLVVLNACSTARAATHVNPANSAIATSLLSRRVPAVVATQFAMPESGAHYFASVFYSALSHGKSLIEALSDGRGAMLAAEDREYLDWGIPVLYATDPNAVIYSGARSPGDADASSLVDRGSTERTRPPVEPRLRVGSRSGRALPVRVVLTDLDAKVVFLPELVRAANAAQDYFSFRWAARYVPVGTMKDAQSGTELFLPRLDTYLSRMPTQLGADVVCCLTANAITAENDDGELESGLIVAAPSNDLVSVVSTYQLREYAAQAGVTFAKSALYLCVGAILGAVNDEVNEHAETAGCPMDRCENREDVVVGLRAMSFEHPSCVRAVDDPEQVAAIRSLLEVTADENLTSALAAYAVAGDDA